MQIINLGFPDGNLEFQQQNIHKKFVDLIRKYRPSIILAPHKLDQHPDHKMVYRICKSAIYNSGTNLWIDKYEPYICKNLMFYSQNFMQPGQGVIFFDVSSVYEEKLELVKIYSSQFSQNGIKTLVNCNLLEQVQLKDSYCGQLINSKFAEQLLSEKGIYCSNIFDIAIV